MNYDVWRTMNSLILIKTIVIKNYSFFITKIRRQNIKKFSRSPQYKYTCPCQKENYSV